MKKVEVVAAIIITGKEILCMQRDKGAYEYLSYKYEFPGGKIEAGESRIDALKREIREELDLKINIEEKDYFLSVQHQYPDFELTMHSYICYVDSKEFVRKEHIDHRWVHPEKLNSLDWAEADIPIVEKLMELKVC